MDKLWQDVRFGYERRRRTALSLVAILTLALGISPNVAIFSLVDAVLLHPLAYRAPEQLVM